MITLSKKLRPEDEGREGEEKWGRKADVRRAGGCAEEGELARAALRLDERSKDGIQGIS